MPKKRVTSQDTASLPAGHPESLAGWQATGTALSVACTAVLGGLGTLVGAVVFAPVIHALSRLRAAAPESSSVADLVAVTLGRRAGAATVRLQTIGYALLTVVTAANAGLMVSAPLVADPTVLPDTWLWPLISVAIVGVVALFVASAPDRVVTSVTAVLAVVGLLAYFYLALAVIASVLSGGAAVIATGSFPGTPINGLAAISALLVIGAKLAGFDVVTTRTDRVRSVGRPMGMAIGVIAAMALLLWYAAHLGTKSGFRFDAWNFTDAVFGIYPEMGVVVMAFGAGCLFLALLLALLWGISRLVRFAPAPPGIAMAVMVVAIAVLVAAKCRDWPGASSATDFVGTILLLVVYAVAVEASARLDGGTLVWWSRILTPAALATIVLFPVVTSRFAAASLVPAAVAAALVGIVALTAGSGVRGQSGTSTASGVEPGR